MIYLVSGLPRSGTSLMMQMLSAGGLEVCTDGARAADDDNPRGYYEDERVKRLEKDARWLDEAEGKLLKVISLLLRALPADRSYKTIFMERHTDEILQSQAKMLDRQGLSDKGPDDTRMRAIFENHLRDVRTYLARQSHFDVLYCRYGDVIEDSRGAAEKVRAFLDLPLQTAAMSATVNPDLYRNRAVSPIPHHALRLT